VEFSNEIIDVFQGLGCLSEYFFYTAVFLLLLYFCVCLFSVSLLVHLYCFHVVFVFCAGLIIGTWAVKPAVNKYLFNLI
jgi:hypothetical protein